MAVTNRSAHRDAEQVKALWKAHLEAIADKMAELGQLLAAVDAHDRGRADAITLRKDIVRSGLFDAAYYLATNEDVREAGIDPLDHYVDFGAAEGRNPNRLFCSDHYRREYGHLMQECSDPLLHYIHHGEAAGLRPARFFDPVAYLAAHPHVAAAGISPLWHRLWHHESRMAQWAKIRVARPALRRWRHSGTGAPGVNFVGPVEMVSGLGTSARGYMAALIEAGVTTRVIPWRKGFEGQETVAVSYPEAPLQAINVIHLNADMAHIWRPALADLLTPARYNVAIWYWELSVFRPEWMPLIAAFDEVWCASSFTVRSIGAVSPRPVRLLRPAVPQGPAPGLMKRRHFGLEDRAYVFFYICDIGSKLDRKNPLALVRAYLDAFGPSDGAMLLLKLNYVAYDSEGVATLQQLIAGRPDIVVMNRILSEDELGDLWGVIDCYVSPHRSEGLGLTLIEAMYAGKPVISTPYGGVVDFITQETALPLDFRLVEIEETCEPYPAGFVWADPDIASISQAMHWAFHDRDGARALGAAGRRAATAIFSAEQTGADIRQVIDHIWTEGQRQATAA